MGRIYLQSYQSANGAGHGVERFWDALQSSTSHVHGGLAKISGTGSVLDRATEGLLSFCKPTQEPVGVILASTKGIIEDYDTERSWTELSDPLTPLLENFVRRSEMNVTRSVVVSNACTSSHSAAYLAEQWISNGLCETVFILAVDLIGNFVQKGFRSLQAVCKDSPRAFAENRDGLGLGDGMAVLVLSTRKSPIFFEGISIITEGVTLTRPSEDGVGLERACIEVKPSANWDLILAHGTGTQPNDRIEDKVFARIASNIPITATKWCIGHTLGASGAMDMIAAAEILKRQKVFGIGHNEKIDPTFSGTYVNSERSFGDKAINRVLISSLGFGGSNAALTLSREPV